MFRVKVAGLGVDQAERSPLLILKKEDGDEAFPLPLSHLDAAVIAAVLKKDAAAGPAPHHLFAGFIRQMGYRVLRVEVRDPQSGAGRGRILLGADSEDKITMDAKPIDAIAMAVCFDAPIFLGVEAAQHPDKASRKPWAMDQSAEGEEWTDLLEKFDTDRFGHA